MGVFRDAQKYNSGDYQLTSKAIEELLCVKLTPEICYELAGAFGMQETDEGKQKVLDAYGLRIWNESSNHSFYSDLYIGNAKNKACVSHTSTVLGPLTHYINRKTMLDLARNLTIGKLKKQTQVLTT